MLHLDYVSCLLTVLSTVLVGRRKWQGWLVAGVNSAIISLIGMRTGQWGFVPANAFCMAIYLYNIRNWRASGDETKLSQNANSSARLSGQDTDQAVAAVEKMKIACRRNGKHALDERAAGHQLRARRVSNQRRSRTSL